ncbi:MAG: HD domain-containing protein [Bacteroidetes bacterium]|nr:HD domain-containing protein [Bacteroidota bacterium]
MRKIDDQLLVESEEFISHLFSKKLSGNYLYHNFKHALTVKKYVEIIAADAKLTDQEMNILRISALFHDTGFVKSAEFHEEEGVKIVSDFLTDHLIDQNTINHISEIILATKIPQKPKDKLAKILCDADLMYITTDDCYEQIESMYEETIASHSDSTNRNIFDLESIRFFTAHTFFTDYGKTILQPKKEAFCERIFDRMKRRELRKRKKGTIISADKKSVFYSRGVETLFRVTARNQINLNSIADNKSNILISVNAIVISIIITMLLAGRLENTSQNLIPSIIFLISCLITIVLAIMSTRPNVKWGNFTDEDLKQNKVDLMFFGNFINMDYKDYENAIFNMIENDEHLYSTMIKNQYSLGNILAKKFRLIKISYNIFMIGIIITVVAFIISLLAPSVITI